MIKKLNELSLGQSIFLVTIIIFAAFLTLSTVLSNQLIFSRTDTLIETTSKEINKQVIMNYENYLSNVIGISNTLQKYIVESTADNKVDELSQLFLVTTNIESNILNVALISQDGRLIASSVEVEIAPDIVDVSWFKEAILASDIHHFSGLHTENFFIEGKKDVFTVSKSVQYSENDKVATGVLMIDIDTSNFKILAQQTNLGNKGHIVIMSQNDKIIYSSDPLCLTSNCSSANIISDIVLGGRLVKWDNLNMYVNVNTIKDTRWKIATFINVNEITNTKTDILIRLILIFILTLITTAITSSYFTRRITIPMNTLKNHITLIEHGDFDSRIHVEGQKEVVHLAEAFNTMSNRIKELMVKVFTEQNEKRKTQFIALQNQINPHFLYNTLDSIVSLSENNRNKDVEAAIIALSKFFRMSISNEMNLVELKDEIEHVRNYLLIQQIRYQNTFVFDFEIDDEVMHHKVIKLSLQPLVENAILHGIHPDEAFSTILIKGYALDGFLYIEIFNEGYGISKERINEIHTMIASDQKTNSMGLKNVYQRLKLSFGNDADLILESELDEYTKVIMKMPIGKEESL
ncbi:MAG: two-component system sensor histidine kinase YesM [Erysipelotrichaceae bacterium]|nr:MAG: two-component system sensor histidine kinase [Erysipelotrichaceae bacterium]TXT17991.1 MAG: two-component system sensor histidine kinase YesM [Erysipelotrichaceae bacterium]